MNETARGERLGTWVRGALAFLSLGALSVGFWALLMPRSFYEGFPLAGRGWVSSLGPYNEHLLRDVGAMNLALGVLLALAAILLERRLVQVSLVAYLVYAVPHFVYHLTETRVFALGDNLANLLLLGLLVVLPVVILVRSRLQGKRHREERVER